MYTDDGKHTIFDNVKPYHIVNANIKEFDDIKTASSFKIINENLDNYIREYETVSFPKFNFVEDDELMDLWGFGDVPLMSQNPEYKYKYPKLTKSELIQAKWQTETGVSNKLNRFLRQDANGVSIEDIKEQDDNYNEGLQSLYNKIDKEAEDLINDYNDEILEIKSKGYSSKRKEKKLKELQETKEQYDEQLAIKNKKALHKYNKKNPVLIKKAYEKPAPVIQKTKTPKPVQQPISEGVVESKSSEPIKAAEPAEPSKLTPEQSKKLQDAVIKGLAKKKQYKKRQSTDTADANTVVENLNPTAESYKTNAIGFKNLVGHYKDLPSNATIDDLMTEDQVKVRGFMTVLGISKKTTTLGTLRKKSDNF